jgi:hypothetical protein
MTFKYIYLMGEKRLSGFAHLYDLCHVPLDRKMIDILQRDYSFPPLRSAWSLLNDYDVYINRQQWIRDIFKLAPLDVEFLLYMGHPLPPGAVRGLCSG